MNNKTQVGWAVRDTRWKQDERWHVVGMTKPAEAAGRTILPVYIDEPPTVPKPPGNPPLDTTWKEHAEGNSAPIDSDVYVDVVYRDGMRLSEIAVRSVVWADILQWRKHAPPAATPTPTDPYARDAAEFVENVRHMLGAGYGMGYDAPDFWRIIQARNSEWLVWTKRYVTPHGDLEILTEISFMMKRVTIQQDLFIHWNILMDKINGILNREKQALQGNRDGASEVSKAVGNMPGQAPLSDKD